MHTRASDADFRSAMQFVTSSAVSNEAERLRPRRQHSSDVASGVACLSSSASECVSLGRANCVCSESVHFRLRPFRTRGFDSQQPILAAVCDDVSKKGACRLQLTKRCTREQRFSSALHCKVTKALKNIKKVTIKIELLLV